MKQYESIGKELRDKWLAITLEPDMNSLLLFILPIPK